MTDVKWIRIVTDIFDDEKIILIEKLPEADSIIVIWFKLLCLAGKHNSSGVLLMNDKVAYTDEMLAAIFRRNISTIRLALATFEQFGMIEIFDGVITIPNWGKHQNFDTLEKRNQYMKNYMREYRQKQKNLISDKTNCKVNGKANVSGAEVEREVDIEVDREKNNDVSSLRSDTLSDTSDEEKVKLLWNTLEGVGDIKAIKSIGVSERQRLVKARLKQYGVEGFEKAIEKIKQSDFLQGKNKNGWCITFDWFVKPNNFPKVLEGNYDNKATEKKGEWFK